VANGISNRGCFLPLLKTSNQMATEKKGMVPRKNQQGQGPTGHNYLLAISIDKYQYAPPLSNCV